MRYLILVMTLLALSTGFEHRVQNSEAAQKFYQIQQGEHVLRPERVEKSTIVVHPQGSDRPPVITLRPEGGDESPGITLRPGGNDEGPVITSRPEEGNEWQVLTLRPQEGNDWPIVTLRPQEGNEWPVVTLRPQEGNEWPVVTLRPQEGNEWPVVTLRPQGDERPIFIERSEANVDSVVALMQAQGEEAKVTRSNNIIIGNIGLWDFLLAHYTPRVQPVANQVVIQDINFQGIALIRISFIRAIQTSGQLATARIIAGGLGMNFVTIRLTSARGSGFQYSIDIWGQ